MTILHDKDIREPLFEYLDELYGTIRILEEKNIGSSRADVMMVTFDGLYGIEIKSDADTYARLSSQVKDYDRYYDFNYVVIGFSHTAHIAEHVPKHWGIISITMKDENSSFTLIREALPNPKMKWKKKLELMWRPELAKLQQLNMMPRYRDKSKAFVIEKIVERIENGKFDEDLIRRQISQILMERDYTMIEEELKEYKRSKIKEKKEKMKDPSSRDKLIAQRERARKNFRKKRTYTTKWL